MDENTIIPEVDFLNRKRKKYEFEIVSNKQFFKNKNEDEVPFKPHRISYYGILFTMKGEGFHWIDFEKYPYRQGTVIFLTKDRVHAFEHNPNREAFLMTFTEAFLEKSSFGDNIINVLTLFNYQLYNSVLNLDDNDSAILLTLVMRMKREYDNPDDDFTQEIIQSALKVFLFLCERLMRKNQAQKEKHFYHEAFIKFQYLIKENILQNNQVQFYANKMGVSTKKLNRVTQAILNKPAKDYLNEILVLEIKRFLTNTDLSIKEIAYRTGFDVPTNFVKFFKKNTGITPRTFRKQF